MALTLSQEEEDTCDSTGVTLESKKGRRGFSFIDTKRGIECRLVKCKWRCRIKRIAGCARVCERGDTGDCFRLLVHFLVESRGKSMGIEERRRHCV